MGEVLKGGESRECNYPRVCDVASETATEDRLGECSAVDMAL